MAYVSPTYNTTSTNAKYRLVVDLLEQDTLLNRSRIRRILQAWRTNTGYETYGVGSASVRNDLGAASSQNIISSQKITYNSYTTLFDDGTYGMWVSHNTDGTKSLQVGGYFTIDAPVSGGWNDFTITLPSIPRASLVTATAANIEEATTININRYSSVFRHTLKYSFGALSGTIVDKTDLTNYGWIVPSSIYAQIPNADSGICTITCETYSGETLIGTKTTTFTALVSGANAPAVSATIVDNNAVTTPLTGSINKFIKFISNVGFTITAAAKNSATILSQKITCGALTSNLSSGTLNKVEEGNFTVEATDSRGKKTTVLYNRIADLIPYVKLTINPTIVRNTPTDSKIKMSYRGNYFNGSFGAQSNTLTVKYRYREIGATTWSAYYTLSAPTITGNEYSADNVILAPSGVATSFNYLKSYEFEVVTYDKIYTTGVMTLVSVSAGIPIFDYGKNYFKHNTPVFFDGYSLQEIILSAYPLGAILMNTSGENPSTYIGGTWIAWGIGRVPVGVDTGQSEFNTVEEIGGAKTHTLLTAEMPVHTHTQNSHGHNAGWDKDGGSGTSRYTVRNTGSVGAGGQAPVSVTTAVNNNTGSGAAHNNLQPYITCYMWKRTA